MSRRTQQTLRHSIETLEPRSYFASFTGTSGSDTFYLIQDPLDSSKAKLTIIQGLTITSHSVNLSDVSGLHIDGLANGDWLEMDFSGGNCVPVGGLFSTNCETLVVRGTAGADTVDINGDQAVFGASTIEWAGVDLVYVSTYGGNDSITVDTPTDTNFLNINSGDDDDVIDVIDATGISLRLQPEVGNDTLTIDEADDARLDLLDYLNLDDGEDDVTVGDGSGLADLKINYDSDYDSYPATIGALDIDADGAVKLEFGDGDALRMTSLSIASGGFFDISDSAAIIDYSGGNPINSVANHVASGFNAGAWNGTGINSSVAAADLSPTHAVGYLDNSLVSGGAYASFAGQSIDEDTILLKYTYYGDADLSGVVDGSDYAIIDDGFLNNRSRWYHGDFDFSGNIDSTDYALIDDLFLNQGPPL